MPRTRASAGAGPSSEGASGRDRLGEPERADPVFPLDSRGLLSGARARTASLLTPGQPAAAGLAGRVRPGPSGAAPTAAWTSPSTSLAVIEEESWSHSSREIHHGAALVA